MRKKTKKTKKTRCHLAVEQLEQRTVLSSTAMIAMAVAVEMPRPHETFISGPYSTDQIAVVSQFGTPSIASPTLGSAPFGSPQAIGVSPVGTSLLSQPAPGASFATFVQADGHQLVQNPNLLVTANQNPQLIGANRVSDNFGDHSPTLSPGDAALSPDGNGPSNFNPALTDQFFNAYYAYRMSNPNLGPSLEPNADLNPMMDTSSDTADSGENVTADADAGDRMRSTTMGLAPPPPNDAMSPFARGRFNSADNSGSDSETESMTVSIVSVDRSMTPYNIDRTFSSIYSSPLSSQLGTSAGASRSPSLTDNGLYNGQLIASADVSYDSELSHDSLNAAVSGWQSLATQTSGLSGLSSVIAANRATVTGNDLAASQFQTGRSTTEITSEGGMVDIESQITTDLYSLNRTKNGERGSSTNFLSRSDNSDSDSALGTLRNRPRRLLTVQQLTRDVHRTLDTDQLNGLTNPASADGISPTHWPMDMDEGGMIELIAQSHHNNSLSDGINAVAEVGGSAMALPGRNAETIRLDGAVGRYQAFEVASTPSLSNLNSDDASLPENAPPPKTPAAAAAQAAGGLENAVAAAPTEPSA